MTQTDAAMPRAYDLNNPDEQRRLIREVEGYLRTCKASHHGTDFDGRLYAMEALRSLVDGRFEIAIRSRKEG